MQTSSIGKLAFSEDAKLWAQFIAFAPVVFQVARSMRELGVLKFLDQSPKGSSFEQVLKSVDLSDYGLSVLLDAGESCGLVAQENGAYFLTPVGAHIQNDALTNINMNFTHDVCYQGLFFLEESFRHRYSEGLKVFGQWQTIYEGLTQLPAHVQKSWFEFDHFFSDDAFPRSLRIVFKDGPKKILDVGGNTGKFAIACALQDPQVKVTMLDHPAQLELARENIEAKGVQDRVQRLPMNLLDHSVPFPEGHDTIWMSQFLDCFSKEDILQLLKRAQKAMTADATLYIMETFTDRQRYEASKFCLDMTSVYFTCMANGNSRMYRATDFHELITQAGLKVVEETNNIRLSHTLLKCQRA